MDLDKARNVTEELVRLRERTVGIMDGTGLGICPVKIIDITDVLESHEADSTHTWLRPGVRVVMVYAADRKRTRWYVDFLRLLGTSGFASTGTTPLDDLILSDMRAGSIHRKMALTTDQVIELAQGLMPEEVRG